MNIPFVKMHANGNDFVIIDNRTKNLLFSKSKILLLSNRNTGIGFDQLILLEKSKSNDIFMKIYNSNGKEAKMCGNAATCVASLLFASKDSNSISIETISSKINAKLSKTGSVNTTIELPSQNFLNIVKDELDLLSDGRARALFPEVGGTISGEIIYQSDGVQRVRYDNGAILECTSKGV